MPTQAKKIDFCNEAKEQLAAIKAPLGKEVPLSNCIVLSQREILIFVDRETATLRLPKRAMLANAPLQI